MTDDQTSVPGDAPQYIVSASPPLLQQIIDDLTPDPQVRIVKVAGPSTAPDRIVAQMTDARAEELRQTFGQQVTVEPDQPLTSFS
jgi:hypothetical protein